MVEEILNAKFSPQENDYNWAEPFIGQLVCLEKNLETELILINGYPKCYAPRLVFEQTLDWKQFYEKIKTIIPEQIIMIDDGSVALTIIGYKEYSPNNIHIILADPHITSNRE